MEPHLWLHSLLVLFVERCFSENLLTHEHNCKLTDIGGELWPRPSGGDGFTLKICCGIESVWLGQFTGAWRLNFDTSNGWMSIEDMKNLGHAYGFRISKCAGMKELIFGDPYKEQNCVQHTGAALQLIPSLHEYYSFDLFKWFILCYRWQSGCIYCQIKHSCFQSQLQYNEYAHDQRCNDIFISAAVHEVTNSSAKLMLQIGRDWPLSGTMRVRTYRNALDMDSAVVDTTTYVARPDTQFEYVVDNLQPNTYYVFEMCLLVDPGTESPDFISTYNLRFDKGQMSFCKNESTKTIGNFRWYDTDASTRPGRQTWLAMIATIALLFSCLR